MKLVERLGDAVLETVVDRGETTLVISKERLLEVARLLRDDPEFQFAHLDDLCGVDYLGLGREPRFGVVYHLYSFPRQDWLRLRVPAGEDDPVVDSVVELWPTANFLERETFDLFGIRFAGHPDLTRILMPEDWVGHPLRKDYPIGKEDVAFSHNQDRIRSEWKFREGLG